MRVTLIRDKDGTEGSAVAWKLFFFFVNIYIMEFKYFPNEIVRSDLHLVTKSPALHRPYVYGIIKHHRSYLCTEAYIS